MRHRQPLPKIWLMTDPRGGDPVALVRRLPPRSGIVFRHYDAPNRRALFRAVKAVARGKRHVILLAGTPARARAWGADGAHDRSVRGSHALRSVAVHDAREAALARRVKADLIFVSPVFETRSHAGAQLLGRTGFSRLSRGHVAVALGGMSATRFRGLKTLKPHGWAAIDALSAALTKSS
jgi:thiamine-phosphate pyrophosphorylase